MKTSLKLYLLSLAALVLGLLVAVVPASAVPAPSSARLTVGTHGFVGSSTLTDGQTLSVAGTNFGSGSKISIYQCESDRFVLSDGYVTVSGTDFRTTCISRASGIGTSGNNNSFSTDITVTKTFSTSVGGNAIDCDTAPFPGYSVSAPNRPAACGIFAVHVPNQGAFSTTLRYFAPISFHGPYSCYGPTPTIVGTFYDDTINGTAGDDTIVSPYGENTVNAGGGNDTVCTGALRDVINGGLGNDLIDSGQGNDDVAGGTFSSGDVTTCSDTNTGNDRLYGAQGADVLNGCDGDNRLLGQSGSDILYGGSGNDHFDGGSGSDACHGRGGTDTFTSCETTS